MQNERQNWWKEKLNPIDKDIIIKPQTPYVSRIGYNDENGVFQDFEVNIEEEIQTFEVDKTEEFVSIPRSWDDEWEEIYMRRFIERAERDRHYRID